MKTKTDDVVNIPSKRELSIFNPTLKQEPIFDLKTRERKEEDVNEMEV